MSKTDFSSSLILQIHWYLTHKFSLYALELVSASACNRENHCFFIYRYKTAENEWIPTEARGEVPLPRFAHSAVIYGNELIVYGGVVASDEPERG